MGLPTRWVCYTAWNEAIRAELFDGRAAGRPVYLDIDGPYFEAASIRAASSCPAAVPEPRESLLRSLAGTVDATDVFKRHRGQAHLWQRDFFVRGLTDETPSFLAFLAVLVVVADEMATEGELSANNYFGRLTKRLNSALGTQYTKEAVQRSYYRHVDGREGQRAGERGLWALLNDWLEFFDDERGLVTAFPVDSREYVSVPVSQALIRSSDRTRLHRLFARTFEEYRRPTPEEMMTILSRSLMCPPFSRPLVNMWAREPNRARITDLALAELGSWDSTWEEDEGDEGAGTISGRALLQARMIGGPRRCIQLSLTARSSPRIHGLYSVPQDAVALSRRCLVAGHNDVRIEPNLLGSKLADFVPPGAIDISEVLVRRLELSSDGRRITRSYRAVNLLQLDREEQVFVETDRASAGETLLVLASEALAPKTRDLLSWVARPGYHEADSKGLRGLPEGWVLFTNVEILGQVPDEVEVLPDLEPLLPPRRLELALSGGLALPGGTRRVPEWHSSQPPEVLVSHPDASAHVDVFIRSPDGIGPDEVHVGSIQGMGSAPLPLSRIEVGSLLEVGAEGAGLAAERRLRLRSADVPRQLESAAAVSLLVGDDGFVVSAGRPERATGMVTLGAGAAIEGDELEAAEAGPLPPTAPPWTLGTSGAMTPTSAGGDVDDEEEAATLSGGLPQNLPACILRPGAHFWKLPTSTAETVLGTCMHCGQFQRFRNRYHRSSVGESQSTPHDGGGSESTGHAQLEARVVAEVTIAVRRTPPLHASGDSAEWDLLLDAVSAVGAGTWINFVALASQTVPSEPAREVARILASAGHIEFERDFDGRQVTRWSVAPRR